MIKIDKYIVSLLLLMFIISCPAVLFGQALNNGVARYNAVDSIFIDRPEWKGLKFSEKKSFLDRSYLDIGYGYNDITNGNKGDSFHAAYSLWVAPVHGVEIEYNSFNKGRTELNYLFNLSSYAHRREEFGKFDLILKSGVAVEHDSSREIPKRIGYTTALRAQYRVTPLFYIYAEPSVTLFAGREVVAVQGGISINVGQAAYVIKDYYSRFKYTINEMSENKDNPILAVKTNLLFDIATVINFEAEVPIGERWSVAGEWIFPWWTTCGDSSNNWQSSKYSTRNTLEILSATLEGRYWFGDRSEQLVMTGWYAGIYTSGGVYDLEYDAVGYQGEFFVAAGLSGGYAHTVNKSGSLRMEYSLGFGYLKTDYKRYEEHWGINDQWHTVRDVSGNYRWIGPTRARVSLVWMLNRKANKDK